MCTIRPQGSLEFLQSIAAAESVDIEAVEVVPSIMEWCEQHGIDETNLNRMGKTVRNLTTGRPRILLADEITPSMQSGVCFVLDSRGFSDETSQLQNPRTFLTHLFLHELAHARDDNATEDDCDRWAFSRLSAYAA
jgi:hypothetical protein